MIGQQQSLPELKASLYHASRWSLGMAGELLVAIALENNGYAVSTNHQIGDLRVVSPQTGEIAYVEVKTARKSKDGKYHFTLWKKGHADHRHTDYVILLCVLVNGDGIPFVVPTSELIRQNQAVVCSYPALYRGKLAQFRQTLWRIHL